MQRLTMIGEKIGKFYRNSWERIQQVRPFERIRRWYVLLTREYREQNRIGRAALVLMIVLIFLLSMIFALLFVRCAEPVYPALPDPTELPLNQPTLTRTALPSLAFTPTQTHTKPPEPLPENK